MVTIDSRRLTTQMRKYSPPLPVKTSERSRPAPGGLPPGGGPPDTEAIPIARTRSGEAGEDLAGGLDDAVDVPALEDERGRHRQGIGRHTHQHAGLEGRDHGLVGARYRSARTRRELDRADHPEVANVDDVRAVAQRMQRVGPF